MGAIRYLGAHIFHRQALDARGLLSDGGSFFESYAAWNRYFFLALVACWFIGLVLLLRATQRQPARTFFVVGLVALGLVALTRVVHLVDIAMMVEGQPFEATLPSWFRHIHLPLSVTPAIALLCGLHIAERKPLVPKLILFYVALAIAQAVLLWDEIIWQYWPPSWDDTAAVAKLQNVGLLGTLAFSILLIYFLVRHLRRYASPVGYGGQDPVVSDPGDWRGARAIGGLSTALNFRVVLVVCSTLLGLAAVTLKSLAIAKLVVAVMPLGKVCTTLWIALSLYGLRMRLPAAVRPLAVLGVLLSLVSLVGDAYAVKAAWGQADLAPLMATSAYSVAAQFALFLVLLALAFELAQAFPGRPHISQVRVAAVFVVAHGLVLAWLFVAGQAEQLAIVGTQASAGWALALIGLALAAILSLARALRAIHLDVLAAQDGLPNAPQAVATIRDSR